MGDNSLLLTRAKLFFNRDTRTTDLDVAAEGD